MTQLWLVLFAFTFGALFGTLFEKTLYYSDNVNSIFNKYNLLHLDYSNYPSPDKNINWVCIKKIDISYNKNFFKTSQTNLFK